ncbi:MAG: M20/M25/M40 family metallo-hydrolase [Candidatus Gastranaerophilales bacterium]|nr:M20/M25/M40 family metallo-hydrolase [Candidatus Gastranaerophilales bacterium]
MNLKEIRDNHKLVNLFCTLAEIPSPSLKEEKVSAKILEIFKENNIEAHLDSYGNVKAKVAASDPTKAPIMFSSHMDVIGDDSPINMVVNGNIIETDKKRTLGADDKAGVASAIMLAMEINADKNIKHGGIEITFTRDEEHSMTGIEHVEMDKIDSEYVLVLDADKIGQVQVSGASFTKITVNVKALIGGHSGNDIGDKKRLNAIKLLGELINDIPQGVYKKDELGVVTSINAGAIIGGGVKPALEDIKDKGQVPENFQSAILDGSATNIINTDAGIVYSVRSTDKNAELDLIAEIQTIIDNFNKKYKGLATAELIKEIHLLPFEKSDDETIPNLAKIASKKCGLPIEISSFHAGAETHIYANAKNKYGKTIKPYLLGAADVYNMHSTNEQMDWKSLLKGYEFIKALFLVFNEAQ